MNRVGKKKINHLVIDDLFLRHIFLSGLCLLLSACSLKGDFSRPSLPINQQALFINESAEPKHNQGITRWWERLNDPTLNSFVNELLQNNLSLKEATERVVQARERYQISRGLLLPNLSSGANASRNFTSVNSFAISSSISQASDSSRIYNTNLNADLSISWQVDLFGQIRSSVNVAQAGLLASQYDREAVQHTLIADLLSRRVAISINVRFLELATEVARNQKLLFDIVKRRYDLGTSNTGLVEVYLAEENTRSIEADIHAFERQLAAESYFLDLLLGKSPGSTVVLESSFPLVPPPRDIPICLPIDLLDRRPDLRAAESRLTAADVEIGIAMADLYPNINLGGSLGINGDRLGNLFTSEQLAGSILANITSRLFEGGALRANIRLQESEARELSARYANSVLNALREVETSLKLEQELQRELELQQQSLEAVRNAEVISEARYRQGIETLRQYLEVQQRRYLVEQNWLRLQQQVWNNRINLYLALGGDWISENEMNSTKSYEYCHATQQENLT